MKPFTVTTLAAIAGVSAFAFASLAVSTAADAASVCKGLESAMCGQNTACKWQPAREAGVTPTKAGAPAKTSAKAHCRAATRAKKDPTAAVGGSVAPAPAPRT